MLKLSLVALFVASMATLALAASYLPVEQPSRPVAQTSASRVG
jgi:hypothetical protein